MCIRDRDNTFDIVSNIDLQEVSNAVNQAQKEIINRFDFKGSKSKIELEEDSLMLFSDDDFKLKNVVDILESKLVKRGVQLKSLRYGKIEKAAGDTAVSYTHLDVYKRQRFSIGLKA